MNSKLSPWLIICLLLTGLASTSTTVSAQPGQVQANGIRLAYESFGPKNAETFLLISGTGTQLTMWPIELCEQLVQQGYRVIRFDNRDAGLSTRLEQAGQPDWTAISKALQSRQRPPLPYTLDDMATDAVGLLDALEIKKAHLVGASMGGMIAQRIAYNHADHALSLASIMSGGGKATFPLVAKPALFAQIPPPAPPTDTAAYIGQEVQTRFVLSGTTYSLTPNQLKQQVEADVKRSYYPAGTSRQSAASLAGFYADRVAKLQTIKAPTIVIHGSEDPLVVVDAGRDVAEQIPGASFTLINGMGHSIPNQLASQLASLLIQNAAKAARK
ncbi:alpha/beta fold hydrolase [Spirosoma lituiforme]